MRSPQPQKEKAAAATRSEKPAGLTRAQAAEVIGRIRGAIARYFAEHRLHFAVFGKSEGLDSSVIAGLLSRVAGVRPIGVLLPIESNPETERLGRLVLDHFQIPAIKVDLTREFHALVGNFASSGSLHEQLGQVLRHYGEEDPWQRLARRRARTLGNIKARLRMIALYHIAALVDGLVISTDNFSEYWMGFWTLNGDVGDLAPIQQVWKGLEERTIAEALEVPREALEVVPTDGLEVLPGGTDQDQLGLPYEDLDRVIVRLLQHRFEDANGWDASRADVLFASIGQELNHSSACIAHVGKQLASTRFKRAWPRILTREEIGLPPIGGVNGAPRLT